MGLIKKQAGVDVDFDKKAREFCERFYIMKVCTHIYAQGRLFVHQHGSPVFEDLVRYYYKGDLFNCDAFKWVVLDFSLYERVIVLTDDTLRITPGDFINTLNELDKHILNLNQVNLWIRGAKPGHTLLKYIRIGNGDWRLEQWDSSENK